MEIYEMLFIGIVAPAIILLFSALYSAALARASKKYEIKLERYDLIHNSVGKLIISMESIIFFHEKINDSKTIDEKKDFIIQFLLYKLELDPTRIEIQEHLDELSTQNAIITSEDGFNNIYEKWMEKAELIVFQIESGKISRISNDFFSKISIIQLIKSTRKIEKISNKYIEEIMTDFSILSKKLSEDKPITKENMRIIEYHSKNFTRLREKMILDLEETLDIRFFWSKPKYADIFIMSAWIFSIILAISIGLLY